EMKLVYETHKILNDDSIAITPTAVRVPVYRSHSESVYVETEETITPDEARELLAAAPGIIIQDDPHNNVYPMPLFTSDTDEVYVGRIRRDLGCDTALNMWIAFDQIRKGAATNAVQIAEVLIRDGLI
ncbi:MAG: aspartate-semialdehyde dehydrogenase, partial [Peptococcaceae bacterium]|nr:aspartate-semialdehyde dehydrogenase [Peptococcaceae bacterium]